MYGTEDNHTKQHAKSYEESVGSALRNELEARYRRHFEMTCVTMYRATAKTRQTIGNGSQSLDGSSADPREVTTRLWFSFVFLHLRLSHEGTWKI